MLVYAAGERKVVIFKGLPWATNKEEIVEFLKEIKARPEDILMTYNGE